MSDESSQPVSFVIFGASGDLAHRKLIPSLFSLFIKQRLPAQFSILGFAVNPWGDADLRSSMRKGLKLFADFPYTREQWDQFAKHLFFLQGNFTNPDDYEKLKVRLTELEPLNAGRLYYMAIPPSFIGPIALQLGEKGMLAETTGWRRIVVEKPFGSSYETAHTLNETLHTVMEEQQIYRIDHYLGKDTVQNMLVFRFANTIFEPIWSREYIDHVQISVLEEVGVGHRGGYYDRAGVMRDMFQNHLMQLLAFSSIENPDTLQHEDLNTRKQEILRALRPITAEDVAQNTVRGQYEGYIQEPDVAPDSADGYLRRPAPVYRQRLLARRAFLPALG